MFINNNNNKKIILKTFYNLLKEKKVKKLKNLYNQIELIKPDKGHAQNKFHRSIPYNFGATSTKKDQESSSPFNFRAIFGSPVGIQAF